MKYNTQEPGLSNSYYNENEVVLFTACNIPKPQIRDYLNKYNDKRKALSVVISPVGYRIYCNIIPKNYFDVSGHKEFIFVGGLDPEFQQFHQVVKNSIENKSPLIILTSAFSQSTVLEEVYRRLNKKSQKKLLKFNRLFCSDQSTKYDRYNIQVNITVGKYILEVFEQLDGYFVTICQVNTINSQGSIIYQHFGSYRSCSGSITRIKEIEGGIIAQKLNEEFNKE